MLKLQESDGVEVKDVQTPKPRSLMELELRMSNTADAPTSMLPAVQASSLSLNLENNCNIFLKVNLHGTSWPVSHDISGKCHDLNYAVVPAIRCPGICAWHFARLLGSRVCSKEIKVSLSLPKIIDISGSNISFPQHHFS